MLIATPQSIGSRKRTNKWQLAIAMVASIALAMLGTLPLRAAEPLAIEYLWQTEPKLDIQWFIVVPEFRPQVKAARLHSPSAAQRIETAQSIVRMPENRDLDAPRLRQELMQRIESGEPQPNVRAELVAALCALDDGSAAERLWKLLGDDLLVRPILEQACIEWRKPLPLDLWRERLRNRQGSQQELKRALEGVGATGSQEDVALLIDVVKDGTQPAPQRLAAAHAIGRLSATAELPLAKELRESTAQHADLLAVAVLGKQTAPEVKEFIADIAERGSEIAQRHAYQWMCELDPTAAQAKAAEYSQHADAEVRRLSLLQINNTDRPETIAVISQALGDVHPDLRQTARVLLLERWSRSDKDQQAIQEALAEGLKQEDWKALEQWVRLTVELEQKEHIPRLLELLDNPRPEVCIAAAWGLRRLATDEATLAAMFEHAQGLVERLAAKQPVAEFELRRLAHLLEAFGQRHYEPAKGTLLKFVPKNFNLGLITRMAGIWACGKMWEGQENRSLADQLCARIADTMSQFPEPQSTRFTATLALGWLADPKTRQALVAADEGKPGPIGSATEWALKRIDEKAGSAE